MRCPREGAGSDTAAAKSMPSTQALHLSQCTIADPGADPGSKTRIQARI
jgi:hypothetical protein